MQVQEWNPVLEWFNERFEVNLKPSRDIGVPSISNEEKGKIQRYLMSYNDWAIHGKSKLKTAVYDFCLVWSKQSP